MIIYNQQIDKVLSEGELRKYVRCCTYDDEVWFYVAEALRRGNDAAKALASKLQGMYVDEAQAYIASNP